MAIIKMDYEDQYMLYIALCTVSLLTLLFTSYHTLDINNIPATILIYGLMVITGLSIFHALNSVQELINHQ